MKYKPRNSNFEEIQGDVASELFDVALKANATMENIKDAIAKTIDDWLEAIIDEHLAEREIDFAIEDGRLVVSFRLGEIHRKDQKIDLFYKSRPLESALENSIGWNVESDEELNIAIAAFEAMIKKCRAEIVLNEERRVFYEELHKEKVAKGEL